MLCILGNGNVVRVSDCSLVEKEGLGIGGETAVLNAVCHDVCGIAHAHDEFSVGIHIHHRRCGLRIGLSFLPKVRSKLLQVLHCRLNKFSYRFLVFLNSLELLNPHNIIDYIADEGGTGKVGKCRIGNLSGMCFCEFQKLRGILRELSNLAVSV